MKKVNVIFVVILLIMVIGVSIAYSQEVNDNKIDVKPSLFSFNIGVDCFFMMMDGASYGPGFLEGIFGIAPFVDLDITLSYYFKIIGIDINLKYDMLNSSSYGYIVYLNLDIGFLFSIPFEKWVFRINPIGGFTTDFKDMGFNFYLNFRFDFPITKNIFLGIHSRIGFLFTHWESETSEEYTNIIKFSILPISIIFSVGF